MVLSRRELLKTAGALSALAAGGSLSTLARAGDRILPWRNWSGAQSCIPAARLAPADEGELADLVRRAEGVVRPVGSSHSFSPLVPTDGTLLSLANLSGLIAHDAARLQAEFWGGTRMADIGAPLHAVGQALPNMADIDYQTLAGACATSTHGTGIGYGSYSSTIVGLRLITARGEVLDCDAQQHPDIFAAARVSLGALGVVSRLRLQNVKPYRLRERVWVQDTEELLEDLPRLIRAHDHFEINPLVHAHVALASATDPVDDAVPARPQAGGGDTAKADALDTVQRYLKNFPELRAALTDVLAQLMIGHGEVVDDSYKVYAHVRDVRFNEMEYEVPADAGPACVREILKTIRDNNVRVWMPLEYRYVKADDIPISMFSGRDSCAISVHQYYDMDHHNYFALIEPIFWKYDGRPHWGKLHSLNARHFARLYPRWKEFTDLRRSLDPGGKFLNAHLRSVFGVERA